MHLFEQYLECTATAKALAVLAVEADDTKMSQHFVAWLLLHRDDGLVPSRVERLHIVVLQLDLRVFIEVQERFVRVAVLQVLVDPCRLPSREKHSSLVISIDDFLEATRYFRVKNLDCLHLCPIVFDVFSSTNDFADSISLIRIIASIGRRAPEETTLLKFMRQIQKFPKFGQVSNSCFSASFLLEAESFTNRQSSSTEHQNFWPGVTKTCMQYWQNCWDGQASGHPLLQSILHTKSSRFKLVFFHMHPAPALANDIPHLVYTALPLLRSEHLPVEYSTSVFQHPTFSLIKESVHFARQKNWLPLGICVFRFRDATVVCRWITFMSKLLNFWWTFGPPRSACSVRSAIVCCSSRDWLNSCLNFSTSSLLATCFYELHFEPLRSGVERLAGILEDVLDSAFDVFEVLNLLHWANFFPGFPVRRLRHHSSRPMDWLDQKSRIGLRVVRERPLLPALPL